MDRLSEQRVRRRAADRCEYCRLPETVSDLPHVIDHIIARQHDGAEASENLALACSRCNLHKGPNVAGIDPQTRLLTRLFNPRVDDWATHFRWEEAVLVGLTDVGRTTIVVLAINHPYRLAARKSLIAAGKPVTT